MKKLSKFVTIFKVKMLQIIMLIRKKVFVMKFKFVCLSILLSSVVATAEWVYNPTDKTLSQGTVVLNNVTENKGALVIGDNKANETAIELDFSTGVADNYYIKEIAKSAFNGNLNVTRLVLPDTITYIGESAFLGCSNLKGELVLPDSLTSTGYHPFYKAAIQRIVFGSGMTHVNNWFMKENSALTSIEWNNAITSIGERAFEKCSSVTTFESPFPENIKSVGYSAFHTMPNLTGDNRDLKLLKLTSLGDISFQNCGIRSVEIGGGVPSTRNAFFQAQKLESVILHEGVKTVGWNCFPYCVALTNLVVPASIESVEACTYTSSSMGNAELHIWWNGVPEIGKVDFSSSGLILGKFPVTHHVRYSDKAEWMDFAAATPEDLKASATIVLPPANTSISEGHWGYKSETLKQKVLWFDLPMSLTIMIM